MIFVQRTSKPRVLVKNGTRWKNAIIAATSEETKKKAISKYKQTEIKEALIDMFSGKCGFCESYIENVDFGDIEHFKPKSIFPELAVDWDNLLLSCKKCNGAGQKGDKWPTAEEDGPLIDPSADEPGDFFDFHFDEDTMISLVLPKNPRGKTSEAIYGLNKHTLLKDRNVFVKKLIIIARYYHSDAEAKNILDEATSKKSEYSAFANMVKSKYVSSNP